MGIISRETLLQMGFSEIHADNIIREYNDQAKSTETRRKGAEPQNAVVQALPCRGMENGTQERTAPAPWIPERSNTKQGADAPCCNE